MIILASYTTTATVIIIVNCFLLKDVFQLRYVHHGTIFDCSDDDWDRSFSINIKSMFWMTKAFLPKVLFEEIEI